MAQINWTFSAKNDLQSIYNFISEDSEPYALRFIDKIILKVEILADYPESGRIVPEFSNVNIRELIEGNYRIIYKLESNQNISIIRIHHSARILK